MSINPNFTNVNAETAFFAPAGSGGGGSSFPTGLTVGVGSNEVLFVPGSGGGLGNIDILATAGDINLVTKTGLGFTGLNTGGGGRFTVDGDNNLFWNENLMNVFNTQYGTVSSTTTGADVTLTIPYANNTSYIVLATSQSGQPIITPWAKLLTGSNFQIVGDDGATIGWMAMGSK